MGSSAHSEPAGADRTDEELARDAAAGSTASYDLLVLRYQRLVYALARRFVANHDDADDIAQETFVQAWRSLSRYDPDRPFRPWLCRIATNMALKHLRGSRSRNEVELDRLDGLPSRLADTGSDPYQETVSRSALGGIRRAIGRLKPQERALLQLRAEEEMSYADLAQALGIRIGTVMSRLHRARTALRRYLAEEGIELPGAFEEPAGIGKRGT